MAKSIKSYLGIIHRLGLLAKVVLLASLPFGTSSCRVFRRIFNGPEARELLCLSAGEGNGECGGAGGAIPLCRAQ